MLVQSEHVAMTVYLIMNIYCPPGANDSVDISVV
jgi:hypothetical protein